MSAQPNITSMQATAAQSPSLETSILGTMLTHPELVSEHAKGCEPEDFAIEENQHVYMAILTLHNAGGPIDALLVGESLRRDGILDAIGGEARLQECVAAAGQAHLMAAYLASLRQLRKDRDGGHRGMKTYIESRAAQIFQSRIPPINAVEKAWFAYESGIWKSVPRSIFAPIAQAVLHPAKRTSKHTAEILAHVTNERQVPSNSFRGVYRFNGEDILVNVKNGVLRITKKQIITLEPHSPDHRFSKQIPVEFDWKAACPIFDRTVSEALPDEEDRQLLQLFSGYLLFPDCRYEASLICYGPGGTGKSTIVEAIVNVLGEDLISNLSLGQICAPRPFYIPMIRYAACNLATELDGVEIEDSSAYKKLVSGEGVTAEVKFGDPYTQKTGVKLAFLTNGLPRFKGGTDAEHRRTRFLRFDQILAEEDKDIQLKEKLTFEKSGLLNYMLMGLMELQQLGRMPEGGKAGRSAKARFGISNDPLGSFVAERCIMEPEASEEKESLTVAYADFLDAHGFPEAFVASLFRRLYEKYPSVKQVRLREHGIRVQKVGGIRLKPQD